MKNIINALIFSPPKINRNTLSTDQRIKSVKTVQYILINHDLAEKYIIFAHGRDTNILTIHSFCQELSQKTKTNVIAFEYPGFLDNEPLSEQGCYDNLQVMIDCVINDFNVKAENIYLIGNSLGTGIIINYVSTNSWNTPIMLISPYKTIMSVIVKNMPTDLSNENDMFINIKKIDKATCPIMIVHSEDDDIIDINHAREIYNNIKNKLTPIWLSKCQHVQVLRSITDEQWNLFLEL